MENDITLYKRNRELLKDKKYLISSENINFILSTLPEENRDEARKVWLSRCDQNILDVKKEQMEIYLKSLNPFFIDKEKILYDSLKIDILPNSTEFNASSHNFEKTILIHEALPHIMALFCHYFSKSSSKGKNYITHPAANSEFIFYLANLLSGKPEPIGNFPNLKLIYPDTSEDWEYSEKLTIACIHFVILHEMGHIIHQDEPSTSKPMNHAMEFAADKFAFDKSILIGAFGDKQIDIHCFAPLFSLCVMSLWNNSESNSHPTTYKRIEKMKEHYKNIEVFPKDALDFLFDFTDQVLATMEFMQEDFYERMCIVNNKPIKKTIELSLEAIMEHKMKIQMRNKIWEFWMGEFSPHKSNNFGL